MIRIAERRSLGLCNELQSLAYERPRTTTKVRLRRRTNDPTVRRTSIMNDILEAAVSHGPRATCQSLARHSRVTVHLGQHVRDTHHIGTITCNSESVALSQICRANLLLHATAVTITAAQILIPLFRSPSFLHLTGVWKRSQPFGGRHSISEIGWWHLGVCEFSVADDLSCLSHRECLVREKSIKIHSLSTY